MTELKVHPAAALFPMLGDEEMKALADDIGKNGLHDPIKKWKGWLIDGRNRSKACELSGTKPIYQEMEFENEVELIDYIVSTNVHRRNLNAGQLALLGEALAPMLADAAARRQAEAGKESGKEGGRGNKKPSPLKKGKGLRKGEVNRQIAKKLNVGHDTVAKAKKLAKEAPDLAEKVKKGEMTLGAAYKKMTGKDANLADHYAATKVVAAFDRGLTLKQIAAETGIGQRQVRHIVDDEKKKRKAIADAKPDIDAKTLSMSAQEKLETAVKQHKKKLDSEHDERVRVEAVARADEVIVFALDRAKKEARDMQATLALAHKVIQQKGGLMTKVTYNLIRSCLHPDSRKSVSDDRLSKAFHAFETMEKLIGEDKPTVDSHVPDAKTPEDMAELKRRVAELRKRQRSTATSNKTTPARNRHG